VPAARDYVKHWTASLLFEVAADLRKDGVARFAARFERAYLDGYAYGLRFLQGRRRAAARGGS
jgi:hypothetical protein